MSDVQFFQTRMGRTFYEHTMPELVREIKKLNDLLQKLVESSLEEKGIDDPAGAGGLMNEEK